jgi:hypothetical protein
MAAHVGTFSVPIDETGFVQAAGAATDTSYLM